MNHELIQVHNINSVTTLSYWLSNKDQSKLYGMAKRCRHDLNMWLIRGSWSWGAVISYSLSDSPLGGGNSHMKRLGVDLYP